MKSNNKTNINVIITTEIDGEIRQENVSVEKKDFMSVVILERLISQALCFNINPDIRDAYLINARLNYPEVYNKYYKWVDKFIDLTRLDEERITEINVVYNITGDNINTKQVKALNDERTLERSKELFDIAMALHFNRNNYMKYQEIAGQLNEYADLVEMYYPELYGCIDRNKENKVSR